MSERYVGSTTCTLLVVVLVISVWEMSVPTQGATGEYMNNKEPDTNKRQTDLNNVNV